MGTSPSGDGLPVPCLHVSVSPDPSRPSPARPPGQGERGEFSGAAGRPGRLHRPDHLPARGGRDALPRELVLSGRHDHRRGPLSPVHFSLRHGAVRRSRGSSGPGRHRNGRSFAAIVHGGRVARGRHLDHLRHHRPQRRLRRGTGR